MQIECSSMSLNVSSSSSSASILQKHAPLPYSSSFLKSWQGFHGTLPCRPLTSLRLFYPKINAVKGSTILERSNRAMEVDKDEDFVEVGLIRSTHGVRGELKVVSRTDFPEQRFEQPGIRWIGFNRMGKYTGIRQIMLLSGRNIVQGKEPTWLLTFEGFDTLEKATELIGTTLLVKNTDRPTLSADQIYVPELIGMLVILKESGEEIGSIVDVFNTGASDILRVKLSASCHSREESKESLVWIPFVEEIVPVVDQQGRFIEIIPPKGLLELNCPTKRPEKRELRKQALKSRRKLQERISGVKKRLLALKQEHVLSGLTHGDKFQREALKAQLLTIDFKSFKRAIETSLDRATSSMDSEELSVPSDKATLLDWKGLEQWFRSSSRENMEHGGMVNKMTWQLWQEGLQVIGQGKVAVATLFVNEFLPDASLESTLEFQARQLIALQELGEIISGEKAAIPWVLVSSEVSTERYEELFQQRAYFGLSEDQVFLVESSYLPLVNSSREEGLHKILMESPHRILTGVAGDGQVISDLDDSGVLNSLTEMGVDYLHMVYSKDTSQLPTDPAVFGFIKEKGASVALKVTSEIVEGNHGILSIQKASPCRRKRTTVFRPAPGVATQAGTSHEFLTEHYRVLRLEELTSTSFADLDCVYRVLPSSSYTFSVEYLQYLSQQRYELVYEAELTSVPHMSSKEGLHENNAWQLKCSPYSSLLFCSPLQVALLHL